MKVRIALSALAWMLVFLPACKKKETTSSSGPPPPPEFGSSENNLSYLNDGVRKFKERKGRLPAPLDELVTEKVIARIPAAPPGFAFVLDASSGLVVLQPPAGVK